MLDISPLIAKMQANFDGIESQLSIPEIISDRENFLKLSREHQRLSKLLNAWARLQTCRQQIIDNNDMLDSGVDDDFREMINADLESLDLPDEIRRELPAIMEEEQLYWFDHPVQIGEIQEKNEIIYGLKSLSEAFEYEKKNGTVQQDATLDVLLSISVTHEGLQELASPYLKYEMSRCNDIKDLNIYIKLYQV